MKIVSVTDRQNCRRDLTEQVDRICAGGADMVVLREKDLPGQFAARLAGELKTICARYGTEFCIDGFPDLVGTLGLRNVWVPVRYFLERGRPPARAVMVSVHSLDEALKAQDAGADAIVFGNVYETSCKPGKPAAGLAKLTEIVTKTRIPVYAIGGIKAMNAAEVAECGVAGICMRSALMEDDDPADTIRIIRGSLR